MSLASTELRDLALNLLAGEAEQGVGTDDAAALKVCGKLGDLLSKLTGAEGFRSLVSRALALARNDVAWLTQVSVGDNGTLQGLDSRSGVSEEEATQGEVLLIANLLGLLHTFIGEQLTMQLIKEIWPGLQLEKSMSSNDPKS